MSGSNLEDVLDNANLEDLDSVLSSLDSGASEEEVLASLESGDTSEVVPAAAPPEPTVTPDPEPVVAKAAPAEPIVEDPEPVVLARDGKNEIPYSVLESERQQGAELKAQLDELNRKNALLEQQLTANDITPKDLPENVRFTPEQLADFESYGEVGEAVAILAQQNAALQEQIASNNVQPVADNTSQPDTNPLATNPDTLRWAENDSHWGVVESVNNSLEADATWAGKSLSERIPEIVRRTKAALGESTDDTIDAAAAAALADASPAAPNSLTDVGGEVLGQQKTVYQQLEDGEIDPEDFLAAQTAKGRSMDEVLSEILPAY